MAVSAGADAKIGSLALVFGDEPKGETTGPPRFTVVPVTETSYAYFAQSPDLREPAARRLRYFARFLEHADPAIAADAYQEFAHASFGEVRQAADALPIEKMRFWLLDPRVPPARKGFYALALALEPRPELRMAHADLLRKLILGPADDFAPDSTG